MLKTLEAFKNKQKTNPKKVRRSKILTFGDNRLITENTIPEKLKDLKKINMKKKVKKVKRDSTSYSKNIPNFSKLQSHFLKQRSEGMKSCETNIWSRKSKLLDLILKKKGRNDFDNLKEVGIVKKSRKSFKKSINRKRNLQNNLFLKKLFRKMKLFPVKPKRLSTKTKQNNPSRFENYKYSSSENNNIFEKKRKSKLTKEKKGKFRYSHVKKRRSSKLTFNRKFKNDNFKNLQTTFLNDQRRSNLRPQKSINKTEKGKESIKMKQNYTKKSMKMHWWKKHLKTTEYEDSKKNRFSQPKNIAKAVNVFYSKQKTTKFEFVKHKILRKLTLNSKDQNSNSFFYSKNRRIHQKSSAS